MIDVQSPAIAERSSDLPCHSPSPGGPNERSECHFVCCSGVGRGEGELNLREHRKRHFLYCSGLAHPERFRDLIPAMLNLGGFSLLKAILGNYPFTSCKAKTIHRLAIVFNCRRNCPMELPGSCRNR